MTKAGVQENKQFNAKQRANHKYNQKCLNKSVSFRLDTEKELLEFASRLPNFSAWVKEQIARSKSPDRWATTLDKYTLVR